MKLSGVINLIFLVLLLLLSPTILLCSTLDPSFHSIDLESPHLTVKPKPLKSYSPKDHKDVISCERVHVVPRSRLKLESYASAIRLSVAPSVVIPEKLHNRIQICLHRNASTGMCQCEKDAWKSIQKGIWGSLVSPYEGRYIDVKFSGDVAGSVIVSVEEGTERSSGSVQDVKVEEADPHGSQMKKRSKQELPDSLPSIPGGYPPYPAGYPDLSKITSFPYPVGIRHNPPGTSRFYPCFGLRM